MKILILGIILGAPVVHASDDPPTLDEPRTALMDFEDVQGTLSVGLEIPEVQGIVGGKITYMNSGTSFQWKALLDVSGRIDSIGKENQGSIEVSVGGRFKIKGEEEKNPEIGSYSRGNAGADILYMKNLYVPNVASLNTGNAENVAQALGVVQEEILAILATAGYSMLDLSSNSEYTKGVEVTVGAGVGQLEIDAPTHGYSKETGGLLQVGLNSKVFDGATRFYFKGIAFYQPEGKNSTMFRVELGGTQDIGVFNLSAKYIHMGTNMGDETEVLIDGNRLKNFGLSLDRLFLTLGVRIL